MLNIDKFLEKQCKKQKYLLGRIFIILLLVVFGLESNYKTANINNIVFFNSLVLLFAPLFLEYLFGMDSYTNIRHVLRWAGLLISFSILFIALLSYMGKGTLLLNNKFLVASISLVGIIIVPIGIIKLITILQIMLAVLDYIFTFNPREMFYYNISKHLEDYLDENYEAIKGKFSFEERKNAFKEMFQSS